MKCSSVLCTALALLLASCANNGTTRKLVSATTPLYPPKALTENMSGKVRVSFDIDEQGKVRKIRILESNPPDMFNREVVQAMKKWRYEAGNPAKNRTITIRFRPNAPFGREPTAHQKLRSQLK